ncbi:MAG: hypothetical protein M1269_00790 [Chloroflexi bacterium]|nr:hypothetical protein [Chloroflexota bacterium]
MKYITMIFASLLIGILIFGSCAGKPNATEVSTKPTMKPSVQPSPTATSRYVKPQNKEFQLSPEAENISDKLGRIHNYEVVSDLTQYNRDKNGKITGTTKMKSHLALILTDPKSNGKFYIETGKDLKSPDAVIVTNLAGNKFWNYAPNAKLAQEADLSKLTEEERNYLYDATDPLWSIRTIFQKIKMEKIGEEKLGDKTVLVFKTNIGFITPNAAYEEYWISPDDGVTYKYSAFDENGQEIIVNEIKEVKINQPIDESIFNLTPPEGVKVINVTNELKKQLDDKLKDLKLHEPRETGTKGTGK